MIYIRFDKLTALIVECLAFKLFMRELAHYTALESVNGTLGAILSMVVLVGIMYKTVHHIFYRKSKHKRVTGVKSDNIIYLDSKEVKKCS